MPKGPKGQQRPADVIGCAVMVARIATGEEEEKLSSFSGRSKSGRAGARARKEVLGDAERAEIARKAANARWRKENDMQETQSATARLSSLYSAKREAGLVDVKFLVGSIDEASFDDVATEVLRLEDALDRGDYRTLRFNDKR